jgi:hypothetical protein
MNDQQPQYDCSKVCFYVGSTTTGPRVSFPGVAPPPPTLKRPVLRPDYAIYRDKPLPREAFWRTAEQGPPVWLPPRSAPPESVWVPVTWAGGVVAGRCRICWIFVIAAMLQSDYNRHMNVARQPLRSISLIVYEGVAAGSTHRTRCGEPFYDASVSPRGIIGVAFIPVIR